MAHLFLLDLDHEEPVEAAEALAESLGKIRMEFGTVARFGISAQRQKGHFEVMGVNYNY